VLIIILAIATFCQRRPDGLTMYDVARTPVMAAVPLLLIVLQPDLGTSIIIVLTVSAMLVVAGVPPRLLTLLAVLGSIGIVLAFYLDLVQRYAIDRFAAFLHQNSTSPHWAQYIYNVDNAKNAHRSGGIAGAGLFKGLQTNLGYVPEQHTDFISRPSVSSWVSAVPFWFSSCSPSWPFDSFESAAWPKTPWVASFASASSCSFAFSCFENIGMTMGIMPVTGIPLPLLSYGGSAALVFFTAGGLVLSISRRTGN